MASATNGGESTGGTGFMTDRDIGAALAAGSSSNPGPGMKQASDMPATHFASATESS